jgi:hypothetical protein
MEGKQNQDDAAAAAHPEAVDKLAFSAVAAPGSSEQSAEKDSPNARDLSINEQISKPATKKEVWSYYAFYAADNGIGTFQ